MTFFDDDDDNYQNHDDLIWRVMNPPLAMEGYRCAYEGPGRLRYSTGQPWSGFDQSGGGNFQCGIHWRTDTPSSHSIISQPKTQFDRLPLEILQKILSYATDRAYYSPWKTIFGFYKAWPGSYYAWLAEPLVKFDVKIHSYRNPSAYYFKHLIDSVLAQPQLRFWKRHLELHDDVPGTKNTDFITDGNPITGVYDFLEAEIDFIREAAMKIFGEVDERLVPRVGDQIFHPQMRVRFVLYLLPNIDFLDMNLQSGTLEMTGWPSFNTILKQYRDSLAAREDGSNAGILESKLAVEKYLSSTSTAQYEAADITPFLPNLKGVKLWCKGAYPNRLDGFPGYNLLRLFFLPKIRFISALAFSSCIHLSELEQQPELGSNHKHDARCWTMIDPHCLATLFGTSPVKTLRFGSCNLSCKLGCFLRLSKRLKSLSYTDFEHSINHGAGFHIGDLAWGLDPHKDSLEVLEVTGDHTSWNGTPTDHIHSSMPYVAAGFLPDRITTLRSFHRLREVKLDYWMLTGESHNDGLTNLPESLEILSIEFSRAYPCHLESCRSDGPCEVKMRHLEELLQKKDELLPKLRKLEIIFDYMTEVEKQTCERFRILAMATDLESFQIRVIFSE